MEDCDHDRVYYGVVNLLLREEPIGSVDVWKCRRCGELSCEDKRWGLTELSSVVGFPRREAGTRWCVLVCRRGSEVRWVLMEAKPGKRLEHGCIEAAVSGVVVNEGFTVAAEEGAAVEHRLFVVEGFVNRVIRV